jgi:hypothetical protein
MLDWDHQDFAFFSLLFLGRRQVVEPSAHFKHNLERSGFEPKNLPL